MDEEYFFTGYCRALDNSRMVTVETDGKEITDIACGFSHCPHTDSCPIAEKIRKLMETGHRST